jgi:hypothetical protein
MSSCRLGRERPVSTKLRCLVERFASSASSSWLSRRRVRQKRMSSPTVSGSRWVSTTTLATVAGACPAAFTAEVKAVRVTREVIDVTMLPRHREPTSSPLQTERRLLWHTAIPPR